MLKLRFDRYLSWHHCKMGTRGKPIIIDWSRNIILIMTHMTFIFLKVFWIGKNTENVRGKTVLIWMNQRILINLRVGSIIVHWDESLEKREFVHMWSEVNKGISYIVQSFYYPRTVNGVVILVSWHKIFGRVIKWHNVLPWREVSHSETKGKLKQKFNSY